MLMLFTMLIGVFGALVFSAYFSGMETAAYSSNLQRIGYIASGEGPKAARARRLLPFLNNLAYMVTIILVGNNIANYTMSYFFERYVSYLGVPNAELVATAILTPICFIFGEALPKNIARIYAGDLCIAGANVIEGCRIVLLPLTKTLGGIGALVHRLFNAPHSAETAEGAREEVLALLEAGIADGIMDMSRRGIAGQILSIEARPVDTIMIPLQRVARVKITASRQTIVETIRETGHHHLPVHEGQPDQIVGIITVRDLIIADGFDTAIAADLMHQHVAIARGTSISKALSKLQRNGEHVGVIIDPADGNRAIGVVSVVDIVSHILDAGKPARA